MDFLNIGRCSKTLKTSETISVNGVVSDGPDLPKQVDMAAITKINDTVSILSGGSPYSYTYYPLTWYYNHETESFTPGPNLLQRRRYHGSATIVDKVSKAKIPIVTGGSSVHDYLKSTELLIDGQWQTGTIYSSYIIKDKIWV